MAKKLTQDVLERICSLTSNSKTLWDQLKSFNVMINNSLSNGKYLEVGSFEGRSLAMFSALALSNEFKDPISITCVDSWGGGAEHRQSNIDFQGVEKSFDDVCKICLDEILPKGSSVEKLKAKSKSALSFIYDRSKSYDLILIDGGHKSKEVLSDLVLVWDLLRDGGILIIDDYTWHPQHVGNQNFQLNSPKLGVDSFLNCFSDELTLISGQPFLQLYIKKNSPYDTFKQGSHCLILRPNDLPSVFEILRDLL